MSIDFYAPKTGQEHHFNMSNSNAFHMLMVLGYENPGPEGELDPADVLARAERARRAVAKGQGNEFVRPDDINTTPGTNVFDFGMDLAKVLVRLGWVEELAREAKDAGQKIYYG
jgi:hypothetical protein